MMLNSSLSGSQTGVGIVDLDVQRRNEIEGLLREAGFKAQAFASVESWLDDRRPWSGCLIADHAIAERLDVPAKLAQRGVDSPVLYIGGRAESVDITAALKAGAFDFVSWPYDRGTLAIRIVRALEANARRAQIRQRLESVLDRLRDLSRRQREVMHLVAQGHPNKIVSWELGISERTVEVHRAEAMRRTGAASLAQMVVIDLAANFFEDGLRWSVDQWMDGLGAIIDLIAPQNDEQGESRHVA